MNEITTATGKTFQSDYFVAHKPSKSLYFRIVGAEREEIVNVFSNAEETAVLTYKGKEYVGYTKLAEISDEEEAWKVRMTA